MNAFAYPTYVHENIFQDWKAYLDMERSLAMKCPDISYNLAGTKKVQQVLVEPGMLERFISDPEEIKQIQTTFTGHYSLDKVSDSDLRRHIYWALFNKYSQL